MDPLQCEPRGSWRGSSVSLPCSPNPGYAGRRGTRLVETKKTDGAANNGGLFVIADEDGFAFLPSVAPDAAWCGGWTRQNVSITANPWVS